MAIAVIWLIVNLIQSPSIFFEAMLIGLTNGCIYALVALGYTLVYGILELINFANGDVFMLGGMFAFAFATWFGLQAGQTFLWPLIVVILVLCAVFCALINASIEFVAYRPLRHAPRIAPLITAIGMSFILQTVGADLAGPEPGRLPERAPDDQPLATVDGVVIFWTTPIVVCITVPVLAGLRLPGSAHEAGEGDARDRPGHGRERDHGHQRQPDDLVHVPARRMPSPAPPGSCSRSPRPTFASTRASRSG